MDAHAHLLSLGWAGPGHALDSRPYKQKGHRGLAYESQSQSSSQPQNTGVGLVKPLLVSQRKDRFGIGKKTHEPAAGNEWWLKGFETALGNIGKSESERTSGTATPIDTGRVTGRQKHEGLYKFFVRGGEMEGTIGEELLRRGRKRKSGEMGDAESSSESDTVREERRKKDPVEDFAQVGMFLEVRDKDEKRSRRGKKADALEDFQKASEFFEARSERKRNQNRNSEMQNIPANPDPEDAGGPVHVETKEERRERRRRRKEDKAATAAEKSDEKGSKTSNESNDVCVSKSEKKRRKDMSSE